MATWRRLIIAEMTSHEDSMENVVGFTGTDSDLDVEFYDGYGSPKGKPFTLWTKTRAYFPVCYDGAEWVGSVPRDPCDEIVEHVGGG